jgi:hypothetical protein
VQQQAGIEEKCWLLDIGGGHTGKYDMGGDCGRFVGSDVDSHASDEPVPVGDEATEDSETTAKIANIVTPLLDELYPVDKSHIQIISELGRHFVKGAFALCSRIYRVVVDPESTRRHYYIAQGVQGVFKNCVLCGESFLPIPLALECPSDGEGEGSPPLWCLLPCTDLPARMTISSAKIILCQSCRQATGSSLIAWAPTHLV